MMHAREGYRPTKVLPSAEGAFAQWTEKVPSQLEFVTARELAGLSNENLAALAAEFEASPQRTRKDIYRFGVPAGIAMVLFGAAVLGVTQLSGGLATSTAETVIGAAILLGGAAAICAGVFKSFQQVPLDVGYGRVGLFVGELNEQHPWLYKTFLLRNNAGAERHRQMVLAERGVLRGVDYLMMKQIASVHENMEMTQSARTVREQVQSRQVSLSPAHAAQCALEPTPALRQLQGPDNLSQPN